jgi:hypothetical protein
MFTLRLASTIVAAAVVGGVSCSLNPQPLPPVEGSAPGRDSGATNGIPPASSVDSGVALGEGNDAGADGSSSQTPTANGDGGGDGGSPTDGAGPTEGGSPDGEVAEGGEAGALDATVTEQ